jgi:Triose-phosphate Transporter family
MRRAQVEPARARHMHLKRFNFGSSISCRLLHFVAAAEPLFAMKTCLPVLALACGASAFVVPAARPQVTAALQSRNLLAAAPALRTAPFAAQQARLLPRLQSSSAEETADAAAEKATDIVKAAQPSSDLQKTLKVGVYFGLWYLFNIGYNIYNKTALNMLPLPWLMATMQVSCAAQSLQRK